MGRGVATHNFLLVSVSIRSGRARAVPQHHMASPSSISQAANMLYSRASGVGSFSTIPT